MKQGLGKSLVSVKTQDHLNSCDFVVLYFGAHWSPPCRLLTERLSTFYEDVRKEQIRFEIVFVSDDGNNEAFFKNFSEMRWVALPFQDQERKMQLKEMIGINAIPNLTVLYAQTG